MLGILKGLRGKGEDLCYELWGKYSKGILNLGNMNFIILVGEMYFIIFVLV